MTSPPKHPRLLSGTLAALALASSLTGCVASDDAATDDGADVAAATRDLTFPTPLPPPSHYSLEASQSRVKNQFDRNVSWAFATTAALEAVYKRKYNLDLDLSENYLIRVASLANGPATSPYSSRTPVSGKASILGATSTLRLPEERDA